MTEPLSVASYLTHPTTSSNDMGGKLEDLALAGEVGQERDARAPVHCSEVHDELDRVALVMADAIERRVLFRRG
eukprot:437511-Rhodomonas_salina.2